MKENNYSPYGTFSAQKINAPKPKSNKAQKADKITGKGDLRVKGSK